MASVEEFDEDYWNDILAELRQLVVGSGFIEWDASMIRSLNEESSDDPDEDWHSDDSSYMRLIYYAKELRGFLSIRTEENLVRLQRELAERVVTSENRPVSECLVVGQGGRREVSVFSGNRTDGMVVELDHFIRSILEPYRPLRDEGDLE